MPKCASIAKQAVTTLNKQTKGMSTSTYVPLRNSQLGQQAYAGMYCPDEVWGKICLYGPRITRLQDQSYALVTCQENH